MFLKKGLEAPGRRLLKTNYFLVEMSDQKRDDWMLSGGFDGLISSDSKTSRQKREDERAVAKSKSEEVHPRELNPQLRPDKDKPVTSSSSSSSSWQRMLVQRSLDRVKRGEVGLEEVAVERFGSMEAFEDACKTSGIRIDSYLQRRPDTRPSPPIKRPHSSVLEDASTVPTVHVPVEDLNKLTARKLKAEMMGDFETVRKLEEQIKLASATPKQTLTLTLLPRELKEKGPVGDEASIGKMVEHERLASRSELDEELARKIAKNSRFSDRPEGMEEFGDRFGESSSSSRPSKSSKPASRSVAVDRVKKMERIQESCWFCLDSSRVDKSLIIAYGQYTYLSLPKQGQLGPLHCQIVPIEHVCSMLQVSDQEAVWDEVRNFKKCLLKMAAEQGQRMVFLEASMDFTSLRHAFIDCVALPADLGTDPQAFYKKALLECDTEWSQHKRILDTTSASGLRKCIPKNFPYLYVDFRLDQGYAHVVEDEEVVGADFLRKLTAGLLGLETDYKSKKLGEGIKEAFIKAYTPHDWTHLLHDQ